MSIIVGICAALVLASAGPADGFYAAVQTGGVEIKPVNRKSIGLGKPLTIEVAKARVDSNNNENTQFSVYVGTNQPVSGQPAGIVLCASGSCIALPQSGSATGQALIFADFSIPADAARAAARYLGVEARLHEPPVYSLRTTFVPIKRAFSTNETVRVKMQIENVGRAPAAFIVGGMNRGPRDQQFGFTAEGPDGPVKDTGETWSMGGLSYVKVLQPGETLEKDVDLRKWFTLRSATYTVTGSYTLPFVDPISHDDYYVVWNGSTAATFPLVIQ